MGVDRDVATLRPQIVERLTGAGCVAPEEEADELVEAFTNPEGLEIALERRESGVPLAWITGVQRFCGLYVNVDEGVYVPRRQSEVLARTAASLLRQAGNRLEEADPDRSSQRPSRRARAVDLCTGSGAIAAYLAASNPGASVVAVDDDKRAVSCARSNGLTVVLSDLGDALRGDAFDVVTAVAPYVPTDSLRFLPADVQSYEPKRALDGGGDGLDVVRRVVRCSSRILRKGGWLLLELGGRQDQALAPELGRSGFGPPRTWFDEDGDLRGLVARWKGGAP